MKISIDDWMNFTRKLSKLNAEASELVQDYAVENGLDDPELLDYAYGVVLRYGEASAALSAEMYDEIARLEGKILPDAEVAETPTKNEVAKAVNGTKKTGNPKNVGNAVGRLVKRTGADTMLKNAARDGAQFAWIPSGDTCPFCLMLASNGWQYMSKKALKNGHAEHIHANCDCTYCIRFDKNFQVEGYDPDKYLEMYYAADGATIEEKANSIRRQMYAQNKDKINAQKRANYAEKISKSLEMKLSDSDGLFKTDDTRENENRKSIIKPKNIRKDLEKTEVGRRAINLIEKHKTPVYFSYGQNNRDNRDREMNGYYDIDDNKIVIFADKTKTIKKTARAVVHEAFHTEDFGICQKSEVYCVMMEMMHEKGTTELTKDEIKSIIKAVKKVYYELPWR